MIDLLLTNARVYTVDPAQPWAEAVAVRDGRIVAAGRAADLDALAGPATRRIDCGGRLLLPGLVDAHVHLLATAVRRRQVSLFGLSDLDAVRARLAAAAATVAPGEWLLGWGGTATAGTSSRRRPCSTPSCPTTPWPWRAWTCTPGG